MKVGTLYDLVKQYLPTVSKRMFTVMYNEALAKITQDLKVNVVSEITTSDQFDDLTKKIVKVISVSVNDEEISRVIKR